ncbi:metastasis-associated protein MTA3-like isoform X2 [Dysidea avara]|uniref:metastasis-associated protein MTA3-like isoform X2 n=1 Tax=Dysidea avara TaxID=196820 RepID=UPI003328D8CF
MAEGLYRIGECVYMEVYPPPTPYMICKIEELRKNSKGSVEVAVKCFFRRRDLPTSLLSMADRHTVVSEEGQPFDANYGGNGLRHLNEAEHHLIKHRELYLTRQIETFKIDMVRGKCSVQLLNELEELSEYLAGEDSFFYTMVYDPNQKTLMVDKGEIRIGSDYQADVPPLSTSAPSDDDRDSSQLEVKMWEPNKMSDYKVEQFLVVARSIGTFARALLDGAKKPQISLRLGAAAASRDITLFHAMEVLHQSNYDMNVATGKLVPRGPVLCSDDLESWTQEEAKKFEDGLQEAKDFFSIQKKHLPWKSVRSVVAYYYMWKTTDRYQIQKRYRMIEKQNDLKEVIVHLRTPTGTPSGQRDLSGKATSSGPMPQVVPANMDTSTVLSEDGGKACEGCLSVQAVRWYSWGPTQENCRVCNTCMTYWRKYGGLKLPTRWENSDRPIPGVPPPVGKKPMREKVAESRGDTLACPVCQRGFKTKANLRRHQALAHNKGRGVDIVPPSPFMMRPIGFSLYIRQKLGVPSLLRAARAPFTLINIDNIPKLPTTSNEILASLISKFHTGRRKPRQAFQFRSLKKQQSQQVNSMQYSNNPLTSPVKSLMKIPSNSPMRRTSVSESVGKQPSVPQLLNKPVIQTSGTFVPPLPPGTTLSTKSVPNKRHLEAPQNGVPAAKQARVTAPAPAPDLDSISLSEAQVANPEMLFKTRAGEDGETKVAEVGTFALQNSQV